jgi:hypothetical protein
LKHVSSHNFLCWKDSNRIEREHLTMKFSLALFAVFCAASIEGFSAPIFAHPTTATKQRTAPSKQEGVEIELPNFDELFGRIQQVSPLSRVAIENGGGHKDARGFASIDDEAAGLKWKPLERNPKSLIHQIDKIDNFQNLGCPIIRCRASMKGPTVFEPFAEMIMNVDERAKWDPAIDAVFEAYPINDLDAANIMMGFGKYGDCSKLGVGYCRTKKYLTIPGREQSTMCGIQEFADGSTIIWGTEMEKWHDHLLPTTFERTTRARSHLFSIAVVPTSEDTFDVEYCLQIDVQFPNWVATPILTQTLKDMFRHAKDFYEGDGIQKFIEENQTTDCKLLERHSLLMTP